MILISALLKDENEGGSYRKHYTMGTVMPRCFWYLPSRSA